MEKRIDLHVHSTASDGTLTPTQLVAEAAKRDLCALALTDHDTVEGVQEALDAGRRYGVEVIPGVELSTEYRGTEIHVVGLMIDWHNETLCRQLKAFKDHRDSRNLKMIDRLRKEGFSISAGELYRLYPDAVLTRAHIARFLVDSGQVKDLPEVFAHYIGNGCSCYVERMKITPVQAVRLIRAAGGLSVLAHPCLYRMEAEELENMTAEMTEAGLCAIEAIYSCNGAGDERRFCEMAARYGLLLSGGSDFHGSNKPQIMLGTGKGDLFVPRRMLDALKRYKELSKNCKKTDPNS